MVTAGKIKMSPSTWWISYEPLFHIHSRIAKRDIGRYGDQNQPAGSRCDSVLPELFERQSKEDELVQLVAGIGIGQVIALD